MYTSPSKAILYFLSTLLYFQAFQCIRGSGLNTSKNGVGQPGAVRSRDKSQSQLALRSVGFYVNWAIYQRKFFPSDLAAEDFTHILYGFANIDPNNGKVFLSDTYADTKIMLREYGYSLGYNNLYGCLYELFWLKRKNRNLKVLLSIGGQTYSQNFSTGVNTAQKRANFARTAAHLVQNLGLDGVDLNWGFPLDEIEGEHFLDLLKYCRQELQPEQELSAAAPASNGSTHYLKISDMDKYIDFWNLMAFDFSGKYSQVAGHQANIYISTTSPLSTNNSWVAALDQYRDVPNNKIVIGMPLYGRSFEKTEGPGTAFSGIGKGEWEPGVWDYKSLPRKGAQESNDTSALASWSYDSRTQEMISYDTPNIARQKAKYIIEHGYGGAMWWEASGDKAGDGSIIKTVVKAFKENSSLERKQNQIYYANSTYDNIRQYMPMYPSLSPTSLSGAITLRESSFAQQSTTPASVPVQSPIPRPLGNNEVPDPATKIHGLATFYDCGLGSCGQTHSNNDCVVALPHSFMEEFEGPNPNTNSLCGKIIWVQRNSSYPLIHLTVADKCMGCQSGHIDICKSVFLESIGTEQEGIVPVTWGFV